MTTYIFSNSQKHCNMVAIVLQKNKLISQSTRRKTFNVA